MTGWLLDTNVISAAASARAGQAEALVAWLERRSDRLYLSAVTVAEIESGIAGLRREAAARRAAALTAWLEALLHLYGGRVLSFDLAAARIAGPLLDAARAKGAAPGFADVAIAATAKAHDLILLTRNTRQFEPLEIELADPFAALRR